MVEGWAWVVSKGRARSAPQMEGDGARITVLIASFILSPLFPNSQLVLMSLLCSTLTSKVDAEYVADGASGPLFEACRDLAPLEPEFILKVPWCEGE